MDTGIHNSLLNNHLSIITLLFFENTFIHPLNNLLFWSHWKYLIFSSELTDSLHIHICLLLIFTFSLQAPITLKCHPGLHNNLIKTKEKRLTSLKPLYSCSSVRPDTPHPILSWGGYWCGWFVLFSCEKLLPPKDWLKQSNSVSQCDIQQGLKQRKDPSPAINHSKKFTNWLCQ